MLKKLLLGFSLLGFTAFIIIYFYSAHTDNDNKTKAEATLAKPIKTDVLKEEPIIQLCSALSNEETYGDDNSFKFIISGKDGWVFRTEMDLKQEFQISNWSKTSFERLQNAFNYNGITLAVMVIPTRGIVGYPNLIAPISYNHKVAQNGYIGLLSDLRDAGYIVADLSGVDTIKDFFLKRDNHWTANGAKYAALKMADAIKADKLYKELRKEHYKTTTTKTNKDDEANDRFLQFIERICDKKPPEELLPAIYNTTLVNDKTIENALFEQTNQPEVVLLGTSNSTRLEPSFANFSGFLREYLSTDIKNEAVAGGAFRGSIASYVSLEKYKRTPTKLIIWELSAHYGLDQKATFRETIPSLYGSCKDEDALIVAKGNLKTGRNYIFDKLKIKGLFSSDYYLYLELENKELRKFKVDFSHYNSTKDKFRVKRTLKNFPKNNGKFFVELKSGMNKPLKTVVVTIKEKNPGAYIAKICKIPSGSNGIIKN